MSRTIERPEVLVTVSEHRHGLVDGAGCVVLTVKDGRIELTPTRPTS